MHIKPLDFKDALDYWYIQASKDNAVRRAGPQASELGWKAYKRYLQSLLESEDDEREFGIHVSSISGYAGWECIRHLWYILAGYHEDPIFAARMLRRFDIGTGMHMILFQRFMPALEMRYPSIEFLNVWYEESLELDDLMIVGTPDIVLEYIDPHINEPARAVIDIKSTSTNQQDRRTRKGGIIKVEPNYQRQVQTYINRVEADYGAILYWENTAYWHFHQVPIQPSRALERVYSKKVTSVFAALEEVEAPAGTLGGHCRECGFQRLCPYYQKAIA